MLEKLKSLYNYAFENIVELAVLASIFMLSGAYGFEYIGGLFPCDLCWPQRYAHMAAIVFGCFALYMRNNSPGKWLRFKILTLFSYAASAGYSGYHAGVEQKWWEGPDSCTLQLDDGDLSMDQVLESLNSVAFVRCDDIPWDLFGISMAGYNFIFSLIIFIMLLLSVKQDVKK